MPAIPKSGLCFPPVPSSKTCTPVEHHIFSFLSLWWGFSNKRVAKFVANLLLLGFGCCHGSYLGAVSPDTTSSFCREGGEHYSFLSPPGGKKSQGTTELHHPELSWPDLPGNFSYWKAEVPRPLVCPCTCPRLRVGNGVGRMAPAQHNAVRGPPHTILAMGEHGAQAGVRASGIGSHHKTAEWAQIPPAASSGMKLSIWGVPSLKKEKLSGSSCNGLQIYKLGCCKEKRNVFFFLWWQTEVMGCQFSKGTANLKCPPAKSGESPSLCF